MYTLGAEDAPVLAGTNLLENHDISLKEINAVSHRDALRQVVE